MKYRLIKGYDLEKLEKAINAALADGWQLYGDIIMVSGIEVYDPPAYNWAQAMIKLEVITKRAFMEETNAKADTGYVANITYSYPSIERGDTQN